MLPFRPQHSLDYVDEADQSFVARPLPPFPTGGFGMGLSEYGRPASYPFDDPVHFYYQQQHQYVKPVAPLSQGPTTAPIRTESQLFSELAAMAYTPQVRGGGGGGWGNRMRYPVDQMQFKLEVAQQPLRARMCGFGDKDRRPITPPPILQLKVYDRSGYALDVNYVDTSFFVVMCDLWSPDGSTETNLVVHRSANSGLPATTTSPTAVSRTTPTASPPSPNTPTPTPTMVSTRNLIGSVVSSAAKMTDPNGDLGIFFVFQDLSVRTEGTFRLRFSFMDVGSPFMTATNTGPTKIIACVFTDPFTVYSPKKFPGMVESTPLSRCFAKQGIKIPIRKDSSKTRKSEEEWDEQDDEGLS